MLLVVYSLRRINNFIFMNDINKKRRFSAKWQV
jgi:hypothetical protein